jgi:hypothetical protein
MQPELKELFKTRKVRGLSRAEHSKCGAKTRSGGLCQAPALTNGRCHRHGGLSTGPRTEAGKAKHRERTKEHMKRMWEKWRAEGGVPFTDQTRKRLSDAMMARMALKHGETFAGLEDIDWSLDDVDFSFEPKDIDLGPVIEDLCRSTPAIISSRRKGKV